MPALAAGICEARAARRSNLASLAHASWRRLLRFARNDAAELPAAAQHEALAALVVIDLQMILVADAQRVADAPTSLHVEELVDHPKQRRRGLLDQDIAIGRHAAARIEPLHAGKFHGGLPAVGRRP